MLKFVFAFFCLSLALSVGYSQTPQVHQYDISGLTFREEMLRLDWVAEILNQHAKVKAYLVGYNEVGRSKTTAMNRLKRSKNYLIRTHHISTSRIQTLYGGEKDGLTMHIALVNTETGQ